MLAIGRSVGRGRSTQESTAEVGMGRGAPEAEVGMWRRGYGRLCAVVVN